MSNKDLFLKELFQLYDKYGIAISHEDNQGGFILESITPNSKKRENLVEWMKCAHYKK